MVGLATLESIHALLLEERTAIERVKEILREGRDSRTALQEILIQATIEERESRAQFLDGFEELAGYYQVLRWEFTRLYTYLGEPFLVHTGTTSQAPPPPPSGAVSTPPSDYLVEPTSPLADARAS